MMTLCRLGLDNHFATQDFFFGCADFGIADHPAFKQQVARRRSDPAIKGDGRFALTRPGNHPAHSLQLFMDILHRFNRFLEQLTKRLSDRFRASVLNKIGFARLGNQR
ncbi:hypothetical protein D3C85_1109800 [compost metagenome]